MKLIILAFLLLFLQVFVHAGDGKTPLNNVYLKTDMDANFKNITNVNNIVFSKDGSNLTVNLDTFLSLYKGEAKKLIDNMNNTTYLFVSNNIPYVLSSNGLKTVTFNVETPYIRQYEPQAYLTNLVVYQELIIEYPSTIDDSNYAVTYPALTNGAIPLIYAQSFRVGRFVLRDNNGLLEAVNTNTLEITKLAPLP